jgi:hypothetical protein
MRPFIIFIIFLTALTTGCVSKNDEISLVCTGKQSTTFSQQGLVKERSTEDFSKSVRLTKGKRVIKVGIKDLNNENNRVLSWEEKEEETWIYNAGSRDEMFPQSTTIYLGAKRESIDKEIEVDKNQILIKQGEQITYSKPNSELSSGDSYRFRIDRVSGNFEYARIEYHDGKSISHRIDSIATGICNKASQKF